MTSTPPLSKPRRPKCVMNYQWDCQNEATHLVQFRGRGMAMSYCLDCATKIARHDDDIIKERR